MSEGASHVSLFLLEYVYNSNVTADNYEEQAVVLANVAEQVDAIEKAVEPLGKGSTGRVTFVDTKAITQDGATLTMPSNSAGNTIKLFIWENGILPITYPFEG